MTIETLERLKRAASAKPNGNASNVRANDLTALIENHNALSEACHVFLDARKHDGYGMDDAETAIRAALSNTQGDTRSGQSADQAPSVE